MAFHIRPPSVSVVFPAFNEEENLQPSVDGAAAVLSRLGADFEVIVVDDCSTDDTGRLADELARARPWLRVIHHERNRKLGKTLRDGFAAATKDLVFYTDCDLPIDFNDIPRGLDLLRARQADAVLGYRLDRGGESSLRAIYSFGYNRLIRCVFGLRVRDINFSYKLIKRDFLQRLDLRSEGSFIDAELLLQLKAAGAKSAEMGVVYYGRRAGLSTLATPAVILKILKELWVFWRSERWRLKNKES